MSALTLRPATAETWPDLVTVIDGRGGPHYCWCMLWRGTPPERKAPKDARRASMRQRADDGVPLGLIGYLDDEPAAWVSVAPRETYRSLGGPPSDAVVWTIACFYVPRRLRGLGFFHQLLRGAVDHAWAQGAEIVEATPVAQGGTSYRFMGYIPAFEALGFEHVATAGKHRRVMWLRRPGAGPPGPP